MASSGPVKNKFSSRDIYTVSCQDKNLSNLPLQLLGTSLKDGIRDIGKIDATNTLESVNAEGPDHNSVGICADHVNFLQVVSGC